MSLGPDRPTFAARVVQWQQAAGRHDLPWQQSRDPYFIWVSEIMLQQTQVGTVVPYFLRFIRRFPDVRALASADIDDVLAHWSGLGYYARARNLHKAAQHVCNVFSGVMPATVSGLQALPGVGRSTAAAISVFAHGTRAAILDGNVKRVIARAFAVEGWPGDREVEDELWARAESLLPDQNVEAYTQGLMDLGSLVCTRHNASCSLCPLAGDCAANALGAVSKYPAARPKKPDRPHRVTRLIVLHEAGEILMVRRAPHGIWGGLWCLPEHPDDEAALATRCLSEFGVRLRSVTALGPLEHAFTHFRLTINPLLCEIEGRDARAGESPQAWMPLEKILKIGIPVPVRKILQSAIVRDAINPVEEGGAPDPGG